MGELVLKSFLSKNCLFICFLTYKRENAFFLNSNWYNN